MNTGRKRDAAIEDLLAAGLRSAAAPPGECPVAEDLATLVEGGLSSAERAAIEDHAASCDRCQQTLALLGAEVPPEVPARVLARRFAVPRLRWLVPATAAAAILIVYFAVSPGLAPRHAGVAQKPPLQVARVEQERPPESAATAAPGTVGPAAETPPPENREARSARTEPARPRKAERAQPGRQVATVPAPAATAAPVPMAERVLVAPSAATPAPEAQMKAGVASGAPPADVQAETQQQPARQGQLRGAQMTPRAGRPVQQAGVAADASKVRPVEVNQVNDKVFVSEATAPSPKIVSAPGGSVRWRLDGGGRLSRSGDGGATFQLQQYRAPSELLSLSAPASSICWAVGRTGLVLLTIDGERWQPRPFPERVDLVGIDARDARHAIATAADGRKFVTDDGGTTWSIIP